jgi:hypothetical protein
VSSRPRDPATDPLAPVCEGCGRKVEHVALLEGVGWLCAGCIVKARELERSTSEKEGTS